MDWQPVQSIAGLESKRGFAFMVWPFTCQMLNTSQFSVSCKLSKSVIAFLEPPDWQFAASRMGEASQCDFMQPTARKNSNPTHT